MLLEFEVERYVDYVDILLVEPVSSFISVSSVLDDQTKQKQKINTKRNTNFRSLKER